MGSRKQKTVVAILLENHLAELAIHKAEIRLEYRFHDSRMWRFDYAVPKMSFAIEIEGGIWTCGRHTTGKGFQDDLDKYNSAAASNWFIFRFSCQDVSIGKDLIILEDFLYRVASRATQFARLNLDARLRSIGKY